MCDIIVKVNFQALGCRLNEAELERWSSEFIQKGHHVTSDSKDADIIVFNTCSVTAEADRKSRNQINKIHKANPDSKLIVTGCYASLQPQQVAQHLGVDLVISNADKDSLTQQVQKTFDLVDLHAEQEIQSSLFARGRHRAFIKVQDGCRYRCSFCIVTLARGDERSQPVKSIVDEINRHHQQGVQEVVITGVHVGGYGSDLGTSLYELLSEILDKTTIPRIRLASVEPWDLPGNFFALFHDKRLMPHMHLPLQSGSDTVLRRMSRRCKTGEFSDLVGKAKSTIPGFNITTDLIVGFPGESDYEWNETLRYVEQLGFGHIHIFSYSPREGTKAATLEGQIARQVKKERSHEMHLLADQLKIAAMEKMRSNDDEVLWEKGGKADSQRWTGYTSNYHKISLQHDYPQDLESRITPVKVTGLNEDGKCLLAEMGKLNS